MCPFCVIVVNSNVSSEVLTVSLEETYNRNPQIWMQIKELLWWRLSYQTEMSSSPAPGRTSIQVSRTTCLLIASQLQHLYAAPSWTILNWWFCVPEKRTSQRVLFSVPWNSAISGGPGTQHFRLIMGSRQKRDTLKQSDPPSLACSQLPESVSAVIGCNCLTESWISSPSQRKAI